MKLTMRLKKDSYDIILKRGCLKNLYQLANIRGRKVFVLTDDGIPPEYAKTVADQCTDATVFTIPQGEASKCLKVYGQVLQAMLDFGMSRQDVLVAVGGGVVGDLGGFCAASYMRGIDFINCPTSTLAQIDSSIGGKTAIDLGETKNIVGAFWQPRAVLIDPDVLATLPRRQYVNGLAEALKAGLIADPQLYALFEKNITEHSIDQDIEQVIYRSLQVKKKIVEQDEHEHGPRAALNFGHTIGHGIEAVKGVRGRRKNGLYHGECVALGMLPMIEDKALVKRTRAIMRALGLPTRASYDKTKVLEQMHHDKKGRGDTITVIKVPGLGCWRADRIPMTDLPLLLGMEAED
ncbi:3-dehydroquinate synthase [uncultured Gemmiger sp.]|uniref:3-dehydroquinate synthase n=1 Tax=uncultured Gemmiger sp. TaxID=1623490 RepID=UPI0025F81AAF|nr:3-dehydroquinate synthase [uncultured Gemmiger sp.]